MCIRDRDDAVGEAFDKAAAILELEYPGGPAISREAEKGNRKAIRFPRTLLEPRSLDFSFSGIKTSVLYHVTGQDCRRDAPLREGISVPDVAASFETAVVDVLIEKLRRALGREGLNRAILGGGVAANRYLRSRLTELAEKEGLDIRFPDLALCTDNGPMIAGLGSMLLASGEVKELSLDASSMASD